MTRFRNRTAQHLIDVSVLALAFGIAFMLRFDWEPPFYMVKRHVFALPYVVILEFVLLVSFGVPRFSWRFVGLREASRIFVAIVASSLVLLATRIAAELALQLTGYAQYALVPIGVILMNFVLAFLGITGVRVLRRIVAERSELLRRRDPEQPSVATILIGAGEAGVLIARELARRPDLGMHAVGFVDDDKAKVGTVVQGVPVLGTTDELARILADTGATQALITIANAPGKAIRRISMRCKELGLATKIIPGVYEIVGGTVSATRIRDVAIDDLLGRDAVHLDEEAISRVVRSRVVMVTGAGGSIGSELCRQICRFGPSALLLVEQAENALFMIHRELVDASPGLPIVPCVADICDASRMNSLFATHKPDVVFHAAAHKHVPMMEWNPGEAVKNNVFGTKTIAELADQHGVAEVVMISTDKAVNPTSVMGATKRAAEIYIQSLTQRSRTKFVTVRFGNVLGSAGSVIPIFKEQIARGGPVTVTHLEMKRYFMTIQEASQLVLQAASMGAGGEIFILDMGEPVKIVDLARDLIRLSGLTPDEDIEIKVTGMRPGEKLFEDLTLSDENADKTRHPKIFVGRLAAQDHALVIKRFAELEEAVHAHDGARLRAKLAEIVPEYRGDPAPGEPARPVVFPRALR